MVLAVGDPNQFCPLPPGHQMGLLLDLNPGGDLEDGGNQEELEAELLALMGGGGKPTAKKNGSRGAERRLPSLRTASGSLRG